MENRHPESNGKGELQEPANRLVLDPAEGGDSSRGGEAAEQSTRKGKRSARKSTEETIDPHLPPRDSGRGPEGLAARVMRVRRDLKPLGGFFQSHYPNLYEAFLPSETQEGVKIEGASFTFAADGSAWRVFFRLPLGGLQTSIAIDDPAHVFECLETILRDPSAAEWKESKRQPRHIKKMKKVVDEYGT